MAINFPNSPSVNDTHTVGGTTYTWDGTVWVTGSISSPTFELVQDTTPQLGGDLDGNSKNISNVGVLTAGTAHFNVIDTPLPEHAIAVIGAGGTISHLPNFTYQNGTLSVQNTGSSGSGDLNVAGEVSSSTLSVSGNTTLTGNAEVSTGRFNIGVQGGYAATITNAGVATFSGSVTAPSFHGDGSALTGIQGLAEPLSNTAPLNKFLKTPKTINIGAGTSLTVENNDATTDRLVFVKEGTIHVSVGGTFRVKQNTKLRLDVLGLF